MLLRSICALREVFAGRARLSLAALLLPVIIVGLVGCGAGGPALAPVSGTVTLDGKPLAGASVSFQPVGAGKTDKVGTGSVAVTDAAGKFTLKTAEATARPGAVVGKHTVRITGAQTQRAPDDDTARPATQDPVPPRYRDGTLTFEVPAAGTDKADFPLQSAQPTAPGMPGGPTGRES